jgi:plastocyanin
MKRLLMASLAVALVVVGCGNSGDEAETSGGEPAAGESAPLATERDDNCTNLTQGTFVQLIAADDFFGPDCIIVKSTATLSLRNVGVRDHNFSISEGDFGTSPWTIHLGDVAKGKTMEMKEPIGEVLEPGTYEFFCSLHSVGMDGVIEVVQALDA